VAKDVKDKVQELLDSVKANILTKLVPLIEAKINDIDKWYKVSKNEATSEINIGKSILDNLIVITYFWNEVNAKYKEEGINNTKCIIALKKSIAEQLKIHEILKK
jgi:hypothetical protein